jgi:hypothetical protein
MTQSKQLADQGTQTVPGSVPAAASIAPLRLVGTEIISVAARF